MCGIAGVVCLGQPELAEQAALRMQRAILHRGPDDHGLSVHTDGPWTVALAHTRLSILDLSPSGHQPMAGTGPTWITFNGEIYNFRELKSTLQPGLYASESDTEVLLRAYEQQGVASFERLRGMYAFAIWDQAKSSLVLARDPLGIKPLYVYRTPAMLVFASEVRALLASGLVSPRLSPAGLESFLETGAVQAPLTIIEGVESLLPGELLTATPRADRLEITSRQIDPELFADRGTRVKTRPQAVTELRTLLEDSVRHHLISDVPVGLFLSGGIDSSALVALASRVSGTPPVTFSVIFDDENYSETPYSRMIAEKFRTDHRELKLTENSILGLLDESIEGMDQPTSDSINTYAISKAVRESGVKVALSGLGGDELFAGYQSFGRARKVSRIAAVPRPLRRTMSTLGRSVGGVAPRFSKLWDLLDSECTPQSVYRLSRQYFSTPDIQRLLNGNYSGPQTGPESSLWTEPVNAVSVEELRGYMTNTLLRDSDFQSMAHALEIRVPFVDRVVVRYVLDLPGEWKFDGQRPKPLLLDAMGDDLPGEIWQRPKQGFMLPFHRWMQTTLRPDVERVLNQGEGLRELGIEPSAAKEVWQKFLQNPGPGRWSRAWAIYALSRWCALHGVAR